MKKSIALVISIMLILSATIPASAVTAKKPVLKKNITLSVMTNNGWIDQSEVDLAKAFTIQTGIKMDYQVMPAEQYQSVLTTKLNSGEATDIYMHQNGKFDLVPIFHDDKNAVDLSKEDWVPRMDKGAIEHDSANGKLLGQTIWDFTPTWVITYNKTIFNNLGLKIPTTYEQFKDICTKILAAGITPINNAVGDGWPQVLWFLEIGSAYEAATPGLEDKLNKNKTIFQDSKIMEKSLAQYQEMAKLGFFGKNYLSDKFGDYEKNMASGKYAMVLHNMTEPQQIETAFPDVKATNFGYFLDPLVDNQIINAGAQGPTRFIYTGSKYINEAKAYFSFMAKPINLQTILDKDPKKMNLCFSGLKGKYTTEAKDFFKRYPKTGTVMQIQVSYLNSQWMDIGKDIVSMFGGKMTPKQVLTSMDARRTQQAKAAKDPAWK